MLLRKNQSLTPLVVLVLLMSVLEACSEGQFLKQSGVLSGEVYNILVDEGVCKRPINHINNPCASMLTGASADMVNLQIYGLKNEEAIAEIAALVVKNGLELTSGVPIYFSFYREPRKAGLIAFFSQTPYIEIEVN